MSYLILLPLLALVADGGWTTEGADAYRSSQRTAGIPAADTGAKVESRIQLSSPFGVGAFTAAPLYSSNTGSAYVVDVFCAVTAIRGGAVVATWTPSKACARTTAVSMSLDEVAGLVVLQSAALSDSDTSSIRALRADTLASAGGVISVSGAVAARAPLLLGGYAWLPSASNGTVHRVDYVTARPTADIAVPSCSGAPQRFFASAVALDVTVGLLAVVSTDGCVTAISAAEGAIVWTRGPLNAGPPSEAGRVAAAAALPPRFTLPPAVDAGAGQLYVGTSDGWVCCLLLAAASPGALCGPWGPTGCSEVVAGAPSPPPPFSAGMALSPVSDAFHQGQVFLLDEGSTLYAVSAQDGSVATSSGQLIAGRTLTAPVVVPDGLGFHWNALLVLSTSGVLSAVSVGDGQTPSDDDSSDDDGVGNAGVVWSLALPAPGGNASGRFERGPTRRELRRAPRRLRAEAGGVSSTADVVTAVGMAVQDDGRIVIPTASGDVFIIAPAHAPPDASSPTVLVVAVTVAVVTGVVAFTCVMWCAYRRRRSIARALFYRYRLRVAFLREVAHSRQAGGEKGGAAAVDGAGVFAQDERRRDLGASLLVDGGGPSLQ